MTIVNKSRPDAAPALFRLLADSAVCRAALDCCGTPLALLDPAAKGAPLAYVNRAFEAFFGFAEKDCAGRGFGALLFRDEQLGGRLLEDPARRWELTAWGKDGQPRPVEATLAAVRNADGKLTRWVIAFADRGEVERLRAEVESLKGLAGASLGLRAQLGDQPARRAQQPGVEIAPADELHADRHPGRVLHQR